MTSSSRILRSPKWTQNQGNDTILRSLRFFKVTSDFHGFEKTTNWNPPFFFFFFAVSEIVYLTHKTFHTHRTYFTQLVITFCFTFIYRHNNYKNSWFVVLTTVAKLENHRPVHVLRPHRAFTVLMAGAICKLFPILLLSSFICFIQNGICSFLLLEVLVREYRYSDLSPQRRVRAETKEIWGNLCGQL